MKLLDGNEIESRMHTLQDWRYENSTLQREIALNNFREAMALMTRIAFEAEDMNHHPDWSNVYNKVHISLSTHDAGGVTELDFELARRIDDILK